MTQRTILTRTPADGMAEIVAPTLVTLIKCPVGVQATLIVLTDCRQIFQVLLNYHLLHRVRLAQLGNTTLFAQLLRAYHALLDSSLAWTR